MWSHLSTGLSVAFVKDVTVALAAAPVLTPVSIPRTVVNHRWVLGLGEPTGDLLLEWGTGQRERLLSRISGGSVAFRNLLNAYFVPGGLLCTGDGEE